MVRIKRLLDMLCGAVTLLSIGPILGYLDRPLLLLTVLVVPTGYWCDRREKYPLPTWLATVIALGGVVFYLAQVTRAEVAIPVVHALVLLLLVRLLTPKEGRDYLQIFVLSLFILAGASLIHLEIAFAVYLVLLVFGVTLGLVLLTVHVTDTKLVMTRADLVKLVKVGLVLPAVSLLLMLVFFVILPRTRNPLWDFLNPVSKGVVGLSESVRPGSFARISTVKELVFRAEGPELAPEDRYWRALVLNQSEQGHWVRKPPPAETIRRIEGPAPVDFEIYLEPRTDRYLITLDRPAHIIGVRKEEAADEVFRATRPIDKRLHFQVQGRPGGRLRVADTVDRDFYLRPPADASVRMRQLASDIKAQSGDVDGRISALAEFFRNQQLSYAQEDLPTGTDAIDEFLFVKKRGYCEFFATAYITMARLVGIPSRLVGGYYGGDYNPIGGYYQVNEDAAHIWVEVLTAEDTWERVDPSQWAINAATSFGEKPQASLATLSQIVDMLNYQWIQAVIFFDLQQQMTLFRDAGKRLRALRSFRAPPGWWKLAVGLGIGIGVVVTGFMWRPRRRNTQLVEAFLARVKKRYGEEQLRPGTGLAEIGEQFNDDACRQFARIYYGAVFRDRRLTAKEVAELKRLLGEI